MFGLGRSERSRRIEAERMLTDSIRACYAASIGTKALNYVFDVLKWTPADSSPDNALHLIHAFMQGYNRLPLHPRGHREGSQEAYEAGARMVDADIEMLRPCGIVPRFFVPKRVSETDHVS